MTDISLIAAYDARRGIGRKGTLPWHIPEDLERFRKITEGHCVVMGRKTWESLPERFRPLPRRGNIVLSRDPNYDAAGTLVVPSLKKAVDLAWGLRLFVIGGEELFREALPLANSLYLTEVHASFGCDRHFPEIDEDEWVETYSVMQYTQVGIYRSLTPMRFVDLIRADAAISSPAFRATQIVSPTPAEIRS